jgi:hypothetical protein
MPLQNRQIYWLIKFSTSRRFRQARFGNARYSGLQHRASRAQRRLLSGLKRTSFERTSMSAYDPKRTSRRVIAVMHNPADNLACGRLLHLALGR